MNYLFCYAFNVFGVLCGIKSIEASAAHIYIETSSKKEHLYVCWCVASFVKNQWIYVFIDTSTSTSIRTYLDESTYIPYLPIYKSIEAWNRLSSNLIWFSVRSAHELYKPHVNKRTKWHLNHVCVCVCFMTTKCDMCRCQDPFDSISSANKIDCENGECVCVCVRTSK